MWVCACVSVLFLLLICDVRVFYSFIFSIGIFSIYILSSCNLTLVLKSRVHTDAIRIHDDDDDDDDTSFNQHASMCLMLVMTFEFICNLCLI